MTLPPGIRIRRDRNAVQASLWLSGRRFQRTIARADELRAYPEERWPAFLERRKAEALRQLAAESPAAGSAPGRLRLSAAWADWIRAVRPRVAQGTVDYYERTGRELEAAIGNPVLAELGPNHVDAFLAHLREERTRRGPVSNGREPAPRTASRGKSALSVASINIRLQNLAAFLRWAHERELIDRPPKVRQLRREHRLPRVPADGDLARLLERVRGNRLHLRALMVALGTGMRRSEVFHLRWDQIDFAAGVIRVQFQPRYRIKERREKSPPMPPFLATFLQAERDAHPDEVYLLDATRPDPRTGKPEHVIAYAAPDALTLAFRRHYDALGIPAGRRPKAFHGFRAYYATRLHNTLGVDVATVQRLLGHSDIAVTQAYFGRTADREKAAVAQLELPHTAPVTAPVTGHAKHGEARENRPRSRRASRS